jgi:hypothetical protein
MENPTITIADIGTELYGSRWQTELAKTLKVSDRTVRRWAAGSGVPRDVEIVLAQLATARAKRLMKLAEFLEDGRLPNKKSNGILDISFLPKKRGPIIVMRKETGWTEFVQPGTNIP